MRILWLFILVILTAGCGREITDFVTSGDKRPGDSIDLPSVSTSNPLGMKTSPGAGSLTGSQVNTRMAITPTHRTIVGSQVKATFTFHQNRPN